MVFLRKVKRCAKLDRIRHEDMREESRVFDLNDRLRGISDNGRNTYRECWIQDWLKVQTCEQTREEMAGGVFNAGLAMSIP